MQIQPGTIKDHHSMNEQPAVSELEVLSLLASSKLNFQNKSSEGCPPRHSHIADKTNETEIRSAGVLGGPSFNPARPKSVLNHLMNMT